MKIINNNRGIALVTALMLTLISLTIIMYLMLMVTSGIKTSGANKRYRSVLDASYGGTDIIIKEVIPKIFTTTLSASLTNPSSALSSLLYPSSMSFTANTDSCLMDKLTKPPSQWGTGCSSTSDPKVNTDFTLKLNSSTPAETYTVYTKIVDTLCSDLRSYPTGKCTGSDLSGYDSLDDGSGTGGGQNFKVKSMPAMYRIEIVAEKTNTPKEKSKLSVLYAY